LTKISDKLNATHNNRDTVTERLHSNFKTKACRNKSSAITEMAARSNQINRVGR